MGGQGGIAGGGNAGVAGLGGSVAAGFGGSFAGHTGSCPCGPGCLISQCTPGCTHPLCPLGGSGGGGAGGQAGAGAAGRGSGGAGAGGAPQSFASDVDLTPRRARGCYPLVVGEGNPCLPADDGLLAWLDQKPADCEPHVVEGPFDAHDALGRMCCYTVACEERSAKARDVTHGLR